MQVSSVRIGTNRETIFLPCLMQRHQYQGHLWQGHRSSDQYFCLRLRLGQEGMHEGIEAVSVICNRRGISNTEAKSGRKENIWCF